MNFVKTGELNELVVFKSIQSKYFKLGHGSKCRIIEKKLYYNKQMNS